MLRSVGIVCLALALNSCAWLDSPSEDRLARCKEIKHRMMYSTNSTGDQMIAGQYNNEMENLNRSYKAENCS